jgi:hypothetical protein
VVRIALGSAEHRFVSVRSCRMDGEEGAPANIAAITQTQDGNYVLTLFDDREGNIWSGSTLGLDRYLDLPTGRPKRLCGG